MLYLSPDNFRMSRYLCWMIFLISVCSCSSSGDPAPSLAGADYFPLEIGRFTEYSVTETEYSVNSAPVTRTYEVRQEIVDTIRNQSGGITYLIYRYKRENQTGGWEYTTTWSARKDINRIVIQEGNIPFIKISLPVRIGLMWNGNALNGFPEDSYEMAGVDAADTLYDGTIVQTLQVIQEEFDDLVVGERDIRHEKYGRNIGLLEREIILLDLCPLDNCPNQEIIESGIEYHETITGYGKVD